MSSRGPRPPRALPKLELPSSSPVAENQSTGPRMPQAPAALSRPSMNRPRGLRAAASPKVNWDESSDSSNSDSEAQRAHSLNGDGDSSGDGGGTGHAMPHRRGMEGAKLRLEHGGTIGASMAGRSFRNEAEEVAFEKQQRRNKRGTQLTALLALLLGGVGYFVALKEDAARRGCGGLDARLFGQAEPMLRTESKTLRLLGAQGEALALTALRVSTFRGDVTIQYDDESVIDVSVTFDLSASDEGGMAGIALTAKLVGGEITAAAAVSQAGWLGCRQVDITVGIPKAGLGTPTVAVSITEPPAPVDIATTRWPWRDAAVPRRGDVTVVGNGAEAPLRLAGLAVSNWQGAVWLRHLAIGGSAGSGGAQLRVIGSHGSIRASEISCSSGIVALRSTDGDEPGTQAVEVSALSLGGPAPSLEMSAAIGCVRLRDVRATGVSRSAGLRVNAWAGTGSVEAVLGSGPGGLGGGRWVLQAPFGTSQARQLWVGGGAAVAGSAAATLLTLNGTSVTAAAATAGRIGALEGGVVPTGSGVGSNWDNLVLLPSVTLMAGGGQGVASLSVVEDPAMGTLDLWPTWTKE